jgi:hypothetical protein
MKSIVGIYDSHEKAIAAIKELQKANYPKENISIIAQGKLVDGKASAISSFAMKEINISVVIGSILGVLTGVGLFAIPGLGFLYGAGILYGGFAGFEAGIVSGGIIAVLTSIGFEMSDADNYSHHLSNGKFMLIVQGDESEIAKAKEILHTTNNHIELNEH